MAGEIFARPLKPSIIFATNPLKGFRYMYLGLSLFLSISFFCPCHAFIKTERPRLLECVEQLSKERGELQDR